MIKLHAWHIRTRANTISTGYQYLHPHLVRDCSRSTRNTDCEFTRCRFLNNIRCWYNDNSSQDMAQVIDTSLADDNEAQSTLFNGSKFWLSRKVPQRSRFIADIKVSNEATFEVHGYIPYWLKDRLMVEKWFQRRSKRTSWSLITQKKKHCRERRFYNIIEGFLELILDSYSYQFIEKSIRNGKLERLSDHAVGTPVGSTVRAVGSSTQPAKTTRQKFTQEDDQILLNWVESSRRKGAKTDGNEIFKQLEAKVCHISACQSEP